MMLLLVVEVELVAGRPVALPAAAHLAAVACQRSGRSVGHLSVAAVRISWQYDDQPHRLPLLQLSLIHI